MLRHSPHSLAFLLMIAVLAAGCGGDEPIRTYSVAKEPTRPARVVAPPTAPVVKDSGPVRLEYDTPEGWQKAPAVMFSKATLTTTQGGEKLLLTVTDMKPAQAALIPNITRWRRQIGLPPAQPEAMAASTSKMKVGERTADYIELVGPEKAARREKYLIAMLPAEGRVWIVKLKAEEKLASTQKDNFDKFVRSLKFKKAAP